MECKRKNNHRKNETVSGKKPQCRIEELQDLLGPEDVDVDLRRILKEARDGRGRIFLRPSARMVCTIS